MHALPAQQQDAVRVIRRSSEHLSTLIDGLLDISKPRGPEFLDRLETLLAERGVAARRYAKPTFTKPARM